MMPGFMTHAAPLPYKPGQGTDYRNYAPWQTPNAESHLNLKFLPEGRDWERLQVHVPVKAAEQKLPCVVFFFGGGWAGKQCWSNENNLILLERGYVVALPDYVLGAQTPEPLAEWDGAAAIRYLRANAARFRIDPERICAIGSSAGGWLVQGLAVSDSATQRLMRAEDNSLWNVPVVEPHPENAAFSPRVVAMVTDWGATWLTRAHLTANPSGWLGPDDPPLFTCVTIPETTITKGVAAYRRAGAVAEVAHTYELGPAGEKIGGKNPEDYGHTFVGVAPSGVFTTDPQTKREMTLGERTLQFLDDYVKHPKRACAPEMLPQGGAIFGTVPVMLRSVHPQVQIHYTIDGSDPSASSAVYESPVQVKAGMTLKALAIRPGMLPSAVATAIFTPAPCAAPVITTTRQEYKANVGQLFSATLQAECARPVAWHMCGKIEAKSLEKINTDRDNSGIRRDAPWLSLDSRTGVLSGVPTGLGVSVVIIGTHVADFPAVNDARSVVVTVE